MSIHSISRSLNTLYTYDMDVGYSMKLFVASNMTPQHHLLSPTPQLSKQSPPLTQVLQCKGAPICPSTAYQGAKTLTLYTYDMDVGCLLKLFVDSNMTPQYNLALPTPQLSKVHPHLHKYNRVRVHPYVYPQYIKVLKQVVYI